jgi:hypothetical protein
MTRTDELRALHARIVQAVYKWGQEHPSGEEEAND